MSAVTLPDPPPGGFRLILCDPPWRYRDRRTQKSTGAARASYRDMTMGELEAMASEIARVSHKDAYLFMWGTKPKAREALALMDAWGFKYLTEPFTWVKVYNEKPAYTPKDTVKGIGHYTRSNAERVLMGRRGKVMRPVDLTVPEIIFAPRGKEHSAKPPVVRDLIVRLLGDHPRVELFARGQPPPGWVFWGDQAVVPAAA